MSNLNDIRVTLSKSNFDVTVKKIDGKLTVTDPITVKNQMYELRSITDIPNVNVVSLVDGSMIIYNANNQLYEIRPLTNLTNLTVSNTLFVNKFSANGSFGANNSVLVSNGSYAYWSTSALGLGGGFVGNTISSNATILRNQSYIVDSSAGWVNMTLPENIANGDIFIIHSLTGNTRILNNSTNIIDIGPGNDLIVQSGETVWLQAINDNNLDIMFTYPAGGGAGGDTSGNIVIAGDGITANSDFGYGYVTLSVNTDYIATLTSNNALYANVANFLNGKAESNLNVNSALYLVGGGNFSAPGPIGAGTPNTAVFTTIQHSGLLPTEGTNIDQILTVADTRAVTTEWSDTGINSSLLPIGSYMLQMVSPLNEIVTGVMSWYPNNTNNQTGDEILLHRATPDVAGTLFLRVYRSANVDIDMVLQIAASSNRSSSTYTYKFRRMI
jgi:hypothetical protein